MKKPREIWQDIKVTFPERTAAGIFMYGLTWCLAPLTIIEPTGTMFRLYKSLTNQPESLLLDVAQYPFFYFIAWKIIELGVGATGFVAGPKLVDPLRKLVEPLEQKIRVKARDFFAEWST